ncbi:MAG: ornithine cyclodeaminase family protein [Chloroflexi bacterium]|nr:ornithine cyclodeaminase family protein [Chloroflexota bacterium]
MALYLTEDDVAQALTMADTLDAVEASLREQGLGVATNLSRSRLRAPRSLPPGLGAVTPGRSILNLMGGVLPGLGVLGYKAYMVTPKGVRFQIFLYSLDSGALLAILEANRIGQLRTGAASGVATKYLARPDAATVGVYGTGYQARGQVEAVCAVRPVRRVVVYGRNPERRALFCAEMQAATGVEVVPAERPEDVARGADIVVTITTSRDPVLEGAWLEPGAHINAAGSNALIRREIDDEAVRRSSRIFADSVEQARLECGDLFGPAERGLLNWSQVRELAEVVAGRAPGREHAEEITLFESHGMGIWDVAAAARAYQHAQDRGLGMQLPF